MNASTVLGSFALALLIACSAGVATADSISVSPTRLLLAPGAQQADMTVRAEGAGVSVVQVRVFGWTEGSPADRLSETRSVAVSPPITELRSNQELTVRIVRIAGNPVRGRECYRVLVDRLPDAQQRERQVALRIRHSVPLCFAS